MKFILIIFFIISVFISCTEQKTEKTEADKTKYNENLMRANKGLLEDDKERMEAYLKRHNWEMTTTKSGLRYMIYEKGKGEKAKVGLLATFKYRVELLDGTVCYSSDSLGLKMMKIGQGGVESGLEEGLLLLNKGDKARFIIPPYMAHGLLGDENKIPMRSIILYDIELLKLEEIVQK